MENATKALLIGAGMLFAVVIVSIIIVAYNNLSEFYQSKQNSLNAEQLAEINSEYGAYDRELTGFEIISLINKVINFNEHHTTEDGYDEMTISVTISNDPSFNKGGLFDGLYGQEITYNKSNNNNRKDLKRIIKSMQELERDYQAEILTKLVKNENYKQIAEVGGDGTIKLEDVIGKTITTLPNQDELKKYSDYLVFKRSKFETQGVKYNKDGQINAFKFIQIVKY